MARRLGYNVVSGYIEHDKGHLEKSVENFFQVFLHLFPEAGPLRAHRAGELYVQALVKQDEIEDHPGHSPSQVVDDPRWGDVRSVFLQFSRTLGLPDAYAEKTTDYFRYHGVRDNRYVHYCLESDRIFTTAVIGNGYWSKILGSLLLLLTECHDKHDSTGLEVGLRFAAMYFEIILKAKAGLLWVQT